MFYSRLRLLHEAFGASYSAQQRALPHAMPILQRSYGHAEVLVHDIMPKTIEEAQRFWTHALITFHPISEPQFWDVPSSFETTVLVRSIQFRNHGFRRAIQFWNHGLGVPSSFGNTVLERSIQFLNHGFRPTAVVSSIFVCLSDTRRVIA